MQSDVITIARTQVGIEEKPTGSNWGSDIREYLESVGISTPAPWCAAFVYWCYQWNSRMPVNYQNPLPKTGYTPLIYNWAEDNDKIIDPDEAVPGDIVLFYNKAMGRIAHVGIVGIVKPDRHVWTIEGNTNDNGSREGYKVARRYRNIDKSMFFVNAFKINS